MDPLLSPHGVKGVQKIETLSSRAEIGVKIEGKLWVESRGSNNGVNTSRQSVENGLGRREVGVLPLGVMPRYMRRVSEVR